MPSDTHSRSITDYGIVRLGMEVPPGSSSRNPSIEYPDYGDMDSQPPTRKDMSLMFSCTGTKRHAGKQAVVIIHIASSAAIDGKMEEDFVGKTFETADPSTGIIHEKEERR